MKYFLSFSLLIILLYSGGKANAQDFIVNNSGDASDSNPGDGICSTALGGCTLRAAIDEANAIAGPNKIDFSLLSGTQINIDSELTLVDNETTINADLGGDGKPDIIIASGAGGIIGFHITGANNIIQGLNLILFTNGIGGPAAIVIDGVGAKDNIIISNFIGTNLAGDNSSAASTNFRSLRIVNGASGNLIGDASVVGRNLISGNTFGMEINASDDNQVIGNIFGLDASGTIDLGNGDLGVEVINSLRTIIGGTGDGRNFISGNNSSGIEINNSANTSIINNYIGTNTAGDAGVGNGADGITITGNSTGTNIGNGAVGGGNVLSGNSNQGLEIGSSGVNVLGNIVGLDATGTSSVPNTSMGIWVRAGATGIIIGNETANGRNTVSGNVGHGIQLSDGPNTVQGNYIGLMSDGNLAVGNSGIGVFVTAGSNSAIGGILVGQGNTISGNAAAIQISAGAHTIFGNTIGLDATRTLIRPNNEGIRLTGTAKGVLIGDGTAAGANIISGNTTDGIVIRGANVNSNKIQLNYIGVLGDLSSPAGNGADGILINTDANLNTINNNVIRNSGSDGIEVNAAFAPLTMDNTFSQNSIFDNTNKGISLVAGAQGNVVPPVITAIATNVSGTSSLFADVEVFLDAGTQGEFYVGMTTADDAGFWSMPIDRSTFPPGLTNMTAIQTTLGNSSEFSIPLLIPLPSPFITTWKTDNTGSSNNNQITIPTFGAGYSYDIYWEEVGAPSNNGTEPTQTVDYTITFPSVGTYRVEISGDFPQIYFANGGDKNKILSVEQWGDITWSSMAAAFRGCSNLQILAVDSPDLSNVTVMSSMFQGATVMNADIGAWNVGNVTNMSSLFRNADSFNQGLINWDVGNVTTMNSMFYGADVFSQNLAGWDVSQVTNMAAMFRNAFSFNGDITSWNVSSVNSMNEMFVFCSAFNQDIGAWDVSNVTDMRSMFSVAGIFNQNINNWNVSNVTSMSLMFNAARNFNQPLDNWDVSSVTNMSQMFADADLFNQNLNSWNAGNVTNMISMFSGADVFDGIIGSWDVGMVNSMNSMFRNASAFNQDISTWNVSSVTSMIRMFSFTNAFDQDIGGWNVANVTNMDGMFTFAYIFNQDITGWDVSSVTNMRNMFTGTDSFNQAINIWNVSAVTDMTNMLSFTGAFNQDLSTWDVSNVQFMGNMFWGSAAFDQSLGAWDVGSVTNMNNMLSNTGLSLANYDATLIGWEALPNLQSGLTLDAEGLNYCAAEVARATIMSTYDWTILDEGLLCSVGIGLNNIYWTEENANQINRSNLDGTSFEQYHSEPAFIPQGIAIDTLNNTVYWTNNWGQIRKGEIDISGFINVADFINDGVDISRAMMGVALDVPAGKIYWASNYDGSLKSADLFAADPNTTVQTLNSGFDNIISVAVDNINGKLYYTENVTISGDAILYQSNLDGTNQVVAFQLPDIGFRDLKLDVANDNIYWSTPIGIYSAKLSDIAGTISSFNILGEAFGIDIDVIEGKIYWADIGVISFSPPEIGRANFDGTNIEILHSGAPNIINPRFIALDVPGVTGSCANPPTASAGPDVDFCESDNRTVFGAIGGGATSVTWTTSGDGTFTAAASVAPSYTPGPNDIANGSVVLTITTDDPDGTGPCLAASDDMIITIEKISLMDAGADQTVCAGDQVQLAGTIIGDPVPIQWFLNGGDGTFDNANNLSAIYIPGPSDIINGSFSLTLESNPALCTEESDIITITISQPIMAANQFASINVAETTIIDVTNGATISLGDVITTTLLTQPQKGTTIINGDGSISYTALTGTVGDDTFDYEIRNQCDLFSSAQITITIINVPPAVDVPPSTIMAGGVVTINVLNNITDDNGNVDLTSLRIIVQPLSGAPASLDVSGNLTVDYTGLKFAGSDELTIEICDIDGLCTSQIILIEVEPPGVVVYNAVSPNSDGKHDFLEIENAEFFPDNHVKIMNRWGDIVFEVSGYDNSTNKFSGTANKGGDGELPTGTYYYTINLILFDGTSQTINGFFTLRR